MWQKLGPKIRTNCYRVYRQFLHIGEVIILASIVYVIRWELKQIHCKMSYTICGAVCFQFTHFCCDDWENIYTLSYYHHQILSMKYYPLFRVSSWNNGVRCMSFYILMRFNQYLYQRLFSNTSLTHWGQDIMAAILQPTFSNTFSWMKMMEFVSKFHWNKFPWSQLIISHHWLR